MYGDSSRRRYGLQEDWCFVRGSHSLWRTFRPAAAEEVVDLPHSWNRHDTFQKGVIYYQGGARYRRSFELPDLPEAARGRRWHLVAGGFYGLADVRLNGRAMARADGQFLGFRRDISDLVKASGANDLEIYMTNRCPRWVLPGTDEPDFLVHGGLAGGLFLESLPALRLLETSVRIEPEALLTDEARIVLRGRLVDQGDDRRRARIRWRLFDASGREVAAADSEEVAAWGSRQGLEELAAEGFQGALSPEVRAELAVPSPRLWSPAAPDLYELAAEVMVGEEAVDAYRLRFGLRQASFSEEGFFLNGERLELHGFNRHEAVPGLGSALPRWLHREDAEKIKAVGGNFVRLAHYPQHPDFLDACDELGLLVYAEVASWKSVRGGRWQRSAERQMRAMILRDRHRPSILLWGMGNESRHRNAYRSLHRMIRRLDPDRASTYAENHLYRARRQRVLGLPDVWGCNYEMKVLEEARDAARLRAVIVSECCNDLAPRGDLGAEKEQLESLKRLWKAIEERPYVAGYCLWSYNDYATMHRDRFVRTTGKFDPWHLPKMSASLFAARHGEEPVLHLFGAWSRSAPVPGLREIVVISNCRRVELRLGGRPVAQLSGDPYQCLELEFEDLDLVATGTFGAEEVRTVLPAHGRATALALHPDRPRISGPGREWVGVTVEAVDADGVRDRGFSGQGRLHLEGPIRSGAYTRGGDVALAGGLGRTFLRAAGEPGTARISATGPELEAAAAEISIHDRRPSGRPPEI